MLSSFHRLFRGARTPVPKAAPAKDTATTTTTVDMKECIDNCRDCERICQETIPHCLSKGGAHARPDHILMLQDCAAICATSATFMIHGSRLHKHTCAACATVCEACATDCEAVMGTEGGEDACMRKCVDACRACAKSCSQMAAGGAGSA